MPDKKINSQSDQTPEEVEVNKASSTDDDNKTTFISVGLDSFYTDLSNSTSLEVSSDSVQSTQTINSKRTKEDYIKYTERVKNYLKDPNSKIQEKQLSNVLFMIYSNIKRYDLKFPKIRVSLAENDSITISWKVGTAYFGASIYADENDSSWTLVQGGARGYTADGYINDPDFAKQLPIQIDLIKQYIKG